MAGLRAGPIVRETAIRRPGYRRQVVTAAVILGVVLAILAAAYLLFLPRQERFVLQSYAWAEVKRADIPETLQASGTVQLSATGDVVAPEAGTVRNVRVRAGDNVEAGALLLEIIPAGLQETLAELEASLRRRTRNREQTELLREIELDRERREAVELERAEADAAEELANEELLRAAGLVSAAEVAKAGKSLEAARGRTEDARSAARSAAIRHDYSVRDAQEEIGLEGERIARLRARIQACTIRSSVTGRVFRVSVSAGDYVPQRAPLLAIGDYSKAPMITLSIPQNVQQRVQVGQQALIDLAGKRYQGIVEWKGVVAEQGTGGETSTVDVRVTFVERPEDLVPGSTAVVEIVLGLRSRALSLPRGPYLTTGGGLAAYRIEGERAHRVEVGFGVTTSTQVEVLNGLEEGERVVTSSYQDFLVHKEISVVPAGGVRSDTTPGNP